MIDIPHFVGQGNVPVMYPSADEVKAFALEMAQGAVSAVRLSLLIKSNYL